MHYKKLQEYFITLMMQITYSLWYFDQFCNHQTNQAFNDATCLVDYSYTICY